MSLKRVRAWSWMTRIQKRALPYPSIGRNHRSNKKILTAKGQKIRKSNTRIPSLRSRSLTMSDLLLYKFMISTMFKCSFTQNLTPLTFHHFWIFINSNTSKLHHLHLASLHEFRLKLLETDLGFPLPSRPLEPLLLDFLFDRRSDHGLLLLNFLRGFLW